MPYCPVLTGAELLVWPAPAGLLGPPPIEAVMLLAF